MGGIAPPLPRSWKESRPARRGTRWWRSWWTSRLTREFVEQTSKTMTEEYLHPRRIYTLKPSTRTFSWGKRVSSSARGGSSWKPDSHFQPLNPTWALVRERRMARVFFIRRSRGRCLALEYFSLNYEIKPSRHALQPGTSSGSEQWEHEQCSCGQHGSEQV